MPNANVKSLLLGNGININFGGRAYTNQFIIKRIIFNARADKYAPLFNGEISGQEIANLFSELAKWANDIRNGKYDGLIEEEDIPVLESFKTRYNWELKRYYEVGLEDWFFILHVYFLVNPDLAGSWISAKQGFEYIMLDAIYNGGKIQELYTTMGKSMKRFFQSYENIFTLNYDNNIEKLTHGNVIHLHGDYLTPANSENPKTIQGYIREQQGERVVIPNFEHCYCDALFDYNGEHKYDIARAFAKGEEGLADLEKAHVPASTLPTPISILIKVHKEHPELSFGVQYHFSLLEGLTGELHIIGLSPNNDSHIFRLIDNSAVTKVVFYYHSESDKQLHLHKPVEYKKVDDLWKALNVAPKKFNCRYHIPDTEEADEFLKVFNELSADPVSKETLKAEIDAIPQFTVDKLCEMVHEKLIEQKTNGSPKDEDDLMRQFREVSRIALREGVMPSALYAHVIMNASKWKTDSNA